MMRLLTILLSILMLPLVAVSQSGRFPNTFTEATTVTNSDFEVYSQKAGNPRRASLNTIKAFMDQDIYLKTDSVCITRVEGDTCMAKSDITGGSTTDYDVWFSQISATDTLADDTLLNYAHIIYVIDMSSASANLNIKLPALPAAPSATQYDGTVLDFIVDRSSAYSVSISGEIGFIGSTTSQTKDTITENRATRYIVSYRNSNREYTNMCFACGEADPSTGIITDTPEAVEAQANTISLSTDSLTISIDSVGNIDMDVSNVADKVTVSVLSSLDIDSVDILSANPATAFIINDDDQTNSSGTADDVVMRFDISNGAFVAGKTDSIYWNLGQLGNYAAAFGIGTQAPSYAELAMGSYNTTVTAGSKSSVNTSDRVLVVGNGTSNTSRSDAFTIYKSGNATLHDGNLTLSDGNLSVTGSGTFSNATAFSVDADSAGVSTTNTQMVLYGAASAGEGVYMAANTAGEDMVMTLKGAQWVVGDGGIDTMQTIKYDPDDYFRVGYWPFDVDTELTDADSSAVVTYNATNSQFEAVRPNFAEMYILSSDPDTITFTGGSTTPDTISGTTSGYIEGFTHSAGRLTYTGSTSGFFRIATSISFSFSESTTVISGSIYKNGVEVGKSEFQRTIGTGGDIGNASINTIIYLETGDYIQFYVAPGTHTGDDDLIVNDLDLNITRIR